MPEHSPTPLALSTRLWFAWSCFFRVLFDAAFARRAWFVRAAMPAASAVADASASAEPDRSSELASASVDSALQLLALFQREGRLVDFLEQDIATFSDGDVGAAARVVHEGCRKALRAHAKIAPIRSEEEGTRVSLPTGFSPDEVKLSGHVTGSGPYAGVLRHKGWRAVDFDLAAPLDGRDARVLAPAEVEL